MLRVQRSSHLQNFKIIFQFTCDFWGFHTKPTVTCCFCSLCLGCNTKNNKFALSNYHRIQQGTLPSKRQIRHLEHNSVPLKSIFYDPYYEGHQHCINDRFVLSELMIFQFTVLVTKRMAFHRMVEERH